MERKYLTAIPIINEKSTPQTREAYLRELRRAGAQRVFVCPPRLQTDEAERRATMALLRENIEFYSANGLEVGAWLSSLGHGAPLEGEQARQYSGFTRIRSLADGADADDSFCPLDPKFVKAYCAQIRAVAEQGPALIMLDDDYRLSLRTGNEVGCACARHMKEFRRRYGENISRRELAETVFSGGPNRRRDVWLDLMGDTLRDFARKLRSTVDSVDPTIRLGLCACIPTWDSDGADSLELARIMAGNTRPFLRFIGGAYWASLRAFGMRAPGGPAELERMQQHWAAENAPDCEIFSEGDAYPRPRWNVPAAYLEGFDCVLRASGGMDGILKYMLDYTASPLYETGYVDRHERNAKRNEAVLRMFSGKAPAGLQVREQMHTLRAAEFSGNGIGEVAGRFLPASQRLTVGCSLPVCYENDESAATLVFGENARGADESFLRRPVILDLPAALILSALGRDVGLVSAVPCAAPQTETFACDGETLNVSEKNGFYRAELSPRAEPLSWFGGPDGRTVSAYRYADAAGNRAVVLAFDAARAWTSAGALLRTYSRQRQMDEAVTWLQGRPLPAYCPKNPGLYLLCRESGGRMALGIWNFSEDPMLAPAVRLGRQYGSLKPLAGQKYRAALDGAFLRFQSDIEPFGFAAFELG